MRFASAGCAALALAPTESSTRREVTTLPKLWFYRKAGDPIGLRGVGARFAAACAVASVAAFAGLGCTDPEIREPGGLQPGPDASSVPPNTSPGPGQFTLELAIDGVTRELDILVPEQYAEAISTPLVVDIHAFSLTKETQASLSGFSAAAREHGFIAMWPQGIANSWNAYACCGQAYSTQVDDVGFIAAAVEEVASRWNVDRTRVYATGFSNGGSMCHRLACERPDIFAAVAPVAFAHDVSQESCAPYRPLSVIQFCGANDAAACGDGKAAISFEAWAGLNGCTGEPAQDGDCASYRECESGVTTTLCSPEASHLDIYQSMDIANTAWAVFAASPMPRAQARSPRKRE